MDPEEIKIYVQMLRNCSHNANNIETLKTTHRVFYEKYPTLFEKAIDTEFPLKYLDWMIEKSKNVDSNSSEDHIKKCDQEVYDQLRKDYINVTS